MKTKNYTLILAFLMSMMGIEAFAHDIEVENSDGAIYYYTWQKNNTELEVSGGGISSEGNYYINIAIPSTVTYNGNTYPVTSIGENAFEENWWAIKNLTIPNSVTSIGSQAFYGCSGLTSITIPNSVTSIGSQAFYGCGLTSITIPNSVTSIGSQAFCGCRGLTSIIVEDGNAVYDSRDNCNAIIETNTNTLIFGCQSTVIPNYVTSIGDNAFQNCPLREVAIPNSVTYIGDKAFYGCTNLSEVTVDIIHPIDISEETFTNSYNITLYVPLGSKYEYEQHPCWGYMNIIELEKIIFVDANVKTLCIQNWDTDGDGELSKDEAEAVTDLESVFKGNTTITSFNELKYFTGLPSFGNETFSGCSGLTSVIIPGSVKSVGDNAFSGCSGLASITIPNSVTSIGNYAFYGCSGLTSITIPNSVTSIGSQAFYGCSGLTSVSIPNSVTSIGQDAFNGCLGLQKVVVEDIAAWCNISFGSGSDNPLYYAHHLYSYVYDYFYGNVEKEITNLIIPNSVTSIGNYAFNGCSGLTSVSIPSSVTSIGQEAFNGCSGLTSITIPESDMVKNIFYDCCPNLTSVTLLDGITTISENAFYGLSNLSKVTIPSSVTSIGENAFAGCTGLTGFTVPSSVTTL